MNSSVVDNFRFFSTHAAVRTDRVLFKKMMTAASDNRRPTSRPECKINHKGVFLKYTISPETSRKGKSYTLLDMNSNEKGSVRELMSSVTYYKVAPNHYTDPPCPNDIVIPQDIQGKFKGDVERKVVVEQPNVGGNECDGKETKKDDIKEKSLMERCLSFFCCGDNEPEDN